MAIHVTFLHIRRGRRRDAALMQDDIAKVRGSSLARAWLHEQCARIMSIGIDPAKTGARYYPELPHDITEMTL